MCEIVVGAAVREEKSNTPKATPPRASEAAKLTPLRCTRGDDGDIKASAAGKTQRFSGLR